jgi:hypothetical protein
MGVRVYYKNHIEYKAGRNKVFSFVFFMVIFLFLKNDYLEHGMKWAFRFERPLT